MNKTRLFAARFAVALVIAALAACPFALSGCGEDENIVTSAPAALPSAAVRPAEVDLVGGGEDEVTILVYLNGSNLETEDGSASRDIAEMVAAGASDKVNVLIETVGTRAWDPQFSISPSRTQRWQVDSRGLALVDDSLPQQDCTDPATLSEFIQWGAENYPADRYMLVLWDHGGGPVYGFGYDEWVSDQSAALTLDEMQTALSDGGVYFDFIGMDCCIMANIETCCALYDYCDYTILSEDFESSLGWSYTDWLAALNNNSSIPTEDLGHIIVDSMVNDNVTDQYGGDSILAMVDEGMMRVLWTAWQDFAYSNEAALLGTNYSQEVTMEAGGRVLPRMVRDDGLSEYYISDLMAIAQSVPAEESEALAAAVSEAIVYMNATASDAQMTGLSVTLPYGDQYFYQELCTVFRNCGFEEEYITWLGKFTGSSANADNYYDYQQFEQQWDGWGGYEDSFDWSTWTYSDSDYWTDDFWGEFLYYEDTAEELGIGILEDLYDYLFWWL